MNLNFHSDEDFIKRLTEIVEVNFKNENFGVSELIEEAGLSHSVIHRRLKSIKNQSVSQFIREIRLKKAKELLEEGKRTVSEIAYEVGFGSPSYFIRCFHEQFGYSPGETKYHISADSDSVKQDVENPTENRTSKRSPILLIATVSIIVLLGAYFIFLKLSRNSSINKQIVSTEKSIMVLPFTNLSSNENNQYFADGIAEDILNQLTKMTDLKVVSRTSAEQFRKSLLSTPEIAKKMKVNYILEGSVRRQDDNVRISVQLIDARQDQHLWSENYDRQLAYIFDIQSDIAQNVANHLQSILSPEEMKQIHKLHPVNAEAYDNYLLGRYLMYKRDAVSIQKAIEYFEKALEIDPDYALAYAGLTDGYFHLSFLGIIERNAGYKKAYEMAEKALEKDSTLAETYAVFGVINCYGYWKWEEARKLFEKALEIDPTCVTAYIYYCGFLDIVGEADKALEQVNRAIELEPFINITYQMKGTIYRNEKKYTESNIAFSKAFALNSDTWFCYWSIFKNYIDLNDETSAIKTLVEIFSVQPGFQSYRDSITPVYETSGIKGIINLCLDKILLDYSPERLLGAETPNITLVAYLYNKLGMQNEALSMLEMACRERFCDIPRRIRVPEYGNLHTDPRFQAMVDTMNLRPYFQISSE